MTHPMIERIAKMTCAASMLPDSDVNQRSPIGDWPMWKDYIPDAKLALKALRDPTDDMLRAMYPTVRWNTRAKGYALKKWQAAIDAVLAEGKEDV